jgi:hypothetical protein
LASGSRIHAQRFLRLSWQITANGRALRDVSEMVTDRLFFAPWRTLNENEVERLSELLINLQHSLQQTETIPLPA